MLAAITLLAASLTTHAAQTHDGDIAVQVKKDGAVFVVNAELTVTASIDEVWDVLTDFDHMAQMLSNVDASQIVKRDGDVFEVMQRSHVSFGLLRVALESLRQVELVPKREIRSRLLKGDVKSSDYSTRIAEDGVGVRIFVHGKFVAGVLSAPIITADAVASQTRWQYQELRDEILRRKANMPPPPCLVAKTCAHQSD